MKIHKNKSTLTISNSSEPLKKFEIGNKIAFPFIIKFNTPQS